MLHNVKSIIQFESLLTQIFLACLCLLACLVACSSMLYLTARWKHPHLGHQNQTHQQQQWEEEEFVTSGFRLCQSTSKYGNMAPSHEDKSLSLHHHHDDGDTLFEPFLGLVKEAARGRHIWALSIIQFSRWLPCKIYDKKLWCLINDKKDNKKKNKESARIWLIDKRQMAMII